MLHCHSVLLSVLPRASPSARHGGGSGGAARDEPPPGARAQSPGWYFIANLRYAVLICESSASLGTPAAARLGRKHWRKVLEESCSEERWKKLEDDIEKDTPKVDKHVPDDFDMQAT